MIFFDAAPLGSERTHAASDAFVANNLLTCSSKRPRERGPRSQLALLRRCHPRRRGAPAGMVTGETAATMPVATHDVDPQKFSIYSINIRCLCSHLGELCAYLDSYQPHLVLVQETWLNQSIQNISIPNYVELSRHDRSSGENRGGVMAFARADVKNIVHLYNSTQAERSWHLFHLDVGTLTIAN